MAQTVFDSGRTAQVWSTQEMRCQWVGEEGTGNEYRNSQPDEVKAVEEAGQAR